MESFPQFSSPRMPTEIKNLIWEYIIALTPPRTLPLKLRSRPYDPKGRDANLKLPTKHPKYGPPRVYAYCTPHPVPVALHVCIQSRHTAMKRWTLAFSCEFITRDHDLIDRERELCGEGKAYADKENGAEEDKRGTIWIDMVNDTLELIENQQTCGHNSDEKAKEVKKPTEETKQITFTELVESVDANERAMVRRLQLQWCGLHSARYYEDLWETWDLPTRHANRVKLLTETFPELEVLIVGYWAPRDVGVGKWRAGLKNRHESFLETIERAIESGGKGRVEFVNLNSVPASVVQV